jgi:hypothetical protein
MKRAHDVDPAELKNEVLHPSAVIPITPLQQQAFEMRKLVSEAVDRVQRESNEALLAVIGYSRATRAAKPRAATQKHQQNAAERNTKIRDAWTAEMDQRAIDGPKRDFGKVDQNVATQLGVSAKTVERATRDLRQKYKK